ncbi:N-acetylglucosamine kinase [Streptomyces sp. LE64]|uniref:N-acetylglucosamine kinase n=1 Tax=Streptomyces sp. LE64 TaxID=3448653 RepID=UPI004042E01B
MTAAGRPHPPSAVLAVDSGGSGLRVVLASDGRARSAPLTSGRPVRTGPGGIDAEHFLEQLVPMARSLMADAGISELAAAAVGAAGLFSLGDRLHAELPDGFARELGVRRLALACDVVTAYAGALGNRPGVVVAGGTGMIATGTDLRDWRRADGWGHLLGDSGGGAWIGRAGLDAAMRAFDGRRGGSAALLARAVETFGEPEGLPGRLYPRTDRPAVLASFAPSVAACASGAGGQEPDPVAADILRRAAAHIVDTTAAVAPAEGTFDVAFTGGLFKMGDPLLRPLTAELSVRLPGARRTAADGDPLLGSVRIATGLAAGDLGLPVDARMLSVRTTPPDA